MRRFSAVDAQGADRGLGEGGAAGEQCFEAGTGAKLGSFYHRPEEAIVTWEAGCVGGSGCYLGMTFCSEWGYLISF